MDDNEPRLVDDKKHAYHSIINSIEHVKGGLFFIDTPGGTGKTFLTNLLLAKVYQRQHIAFEVALQQHFWMEEELNTP